MEIKLYLRWIYRFIGTSESASSEFVMKLIKLSLAFRTLLGTLRAASGEPRMFAVVRQANLGSFSYVETAGLLLSSKHRLQRPFSGRFSEVQMEFRF